MSRRTGLPFEVKFAVLAREFSNNQSKSVVNLAGISCTYTFKGDAFTAAVRLI
jgi:hypothetical protein